MEGNGYFDSLETRLRKHYSINIIIFLRCNVNPVYVGLEL